LAGAKGRSPHTLEAVERLLASGEQEMSAAEVEIRLIAATFGKMSRHSGTKVPG
jgi:hypothetical protein